MCSDVALAYFKVLLKKNEADVKFKTYLKLLF